VPGAAATIGSVLEAHREADPSLLGAVFRRPPWRIASVLARLEGVDPGTPRRGATGEDPDGPAGSGASAAASRPSGGP
jgi:hypothetical protein